MFPHYNSEELMAMRKKLRQNRMYIPGSTIRLVNLMNLRSDVVDCFSFRFFILAGALLDLLGINSIENINRQDFQESF